MADAAEDADLVTALMAAWHVHQPGPVATSSPLIRADRPVPDVGPGEIRIAVNSDDPSGGTQIVMHASDLTLGSSKVSVQGAGGRTIDLDSQSVRVNTASLEVR